MYHMLHSERDEPNLLRTLKDNGYFIWWGGKNDLIPGQQDKNEICDIFYKSSREDLNRWGYKVKPDLHFWKKWRGKPSSDTYYSFYAGKLDKGGEEIYLPP